MFDFENFANLVMEHTNVCIEAEFFDSEDEARGYILGVDNVLDALQEHDNSIEADDCFDLHDAITDLFIASYDFWEEVENIG